MLEEPYVLKLHLGGVLATAGFGGMVVLMAGLVGCAAVAVAAGALWRLAMICSFLRSAVKRKRIPATTIHL